MTKEDRKEIRLFNAKELSNQTGHPGRFRHDRTDYEEIRTYLKLKRDEIINYVKNNFK